MHMSTAVATRPPVHGCSCLWSSATVACIHSSSSEDNLSVAPSSASFGNDRSHCRSIARRPSNDAETRTHCSNSLHGNNPSYSRSTAPHALPPRKRQPELRCVPFRGGLEARRVSPSIDVYLTMFFQGSIQEGISTAVGQQKLLLCFVTDENDESQTWENEYLQDEHVNGMIVSKAIALRLKAGSEEAGYLAQIFPLPKTPTVVIMKHGELKEYIASGTTKDDFLRRLSNVFSAGNTSVSAPAPSTPAANVASPVATPMSDVASPAPSTSNIPSATPEADGSANVRRILAERAAKAQKEAAEREAKKAEAAAAAAGTSTASFKGKGKAVVELPTAASQSDAQKEAADMIKKKKAQQNDERRRILKRIEDDKVARRELAAQRKRQRQEDLAALEAEEKEQQQSKAASRSNSSRTSTAAAIQVRLSDGSTLRNKFRVTESIKDIRDWVDKERSDGNDPYFFKQILTPLPNKNIDTTEEGKSLGELGLSPSSTLLLIPIQRFATAYDAQCPSKGIFEQILTFVFGLFAWLMGIVGLGGDALPAAQAASQGATNSPSAPRNQRVQEFQNPNDRRGDQQLYNGNSLNFEPRPDEEEN